MARRPEKDTLKSKGILEGNFPIPSIVMSLIQYLSNMNLWTPNSPINQTPPFNEIHSIFAVYRLFSLMQAPSSPRVFDLEAAQSVYFAPILTYDTFVVMHSFN